LGDWYSGWQKKNHIFEVSGINLKGNCKIIFPTYNILICTIVVNLFLWNLINCWRNMMLMSKHDDKTNFIEMTSKWFFKLHMWIEWPSQMLI
jgi:hypothetical protein